jgi:quinohemoprotein ethanol dehydrogenase
MAWHPGTGVVYLPVQEIQRIFEQHDPAWVRNDLGYNRGVSTRDDPDYRPTGHLLAWNPRTQTEAWRVKHLHHANGGVLATAGSLVFQGTGDGRLVAYDARDGRQLWDAFLGLGVVAPPVTYRIAGRQYVTIAAGWGGIAAQRYGGPRGEAGRYEQIGRVFTFELGAREAIPLPPPRSPRVPAGHTLALAATSAQVDRGRGLFSQHCGSCHTMNYPQYPGILPDLRFSLPETLTEHFAAIVHDGAYAATKGMPAFKALLSCDDVEAIRAFIVTESKKLPASSP